MNKQIDTASPGESRLSRLHRCRCLLPAIVLFGLFAAAPFAGLGVAQNSSGPTDLAGERKRYEEEIATALQPVQKRYTTRLKALQKLLAKKGDKAGVAAVEAELEKMGTAMAQQLRYPIE